MANEIAKINRKIKAAMRQFIDHEDDGALKSCLKLSRLREELLKARPFTPKVTDK